jgi:hypothetical protein
MTSSLILLTLKIHKCGTQALFPFDKIHGIALDENIPMIKFVGKVKEITTKNWCKLGDMY